MKLLATIICLLLSIAVLPQTYNVPVKSGDAMRIRKNSTNVVTLPTPVSDDSVYNFILTRYKKNTRPVNKPPVVSAGASQSITLPANSVTLSGTATDADGSIVSTMWNNATSLQANFVTPASPITTVTDLVQGSYIFKLTATDNNGATASSSVTVTVNGVPPPPDTSGIKKEGFGASATGGDNSINVYHVTNTNSSGTGSLANGIGSNKTIVFDVSGTIVGRFDIIGASYLTIDGAGQNITINNNNDGDAISFDGSTTHHCVLKNIHVTNAGNDGINVLDGSHDILITNCTSYGNRDGNIDIAGGVNVTVQYCILGNGAAGWAGDMLITATNVTVHHNLFSPSTSGQVGERCPLIHCNYSPVGNPNADVRNNLIWKYGRSGGTGSGYGTAVAYNATANVVNNYYYTVGTSPDSPTNTDDGYGSGATGKAYIDGNVSGNSGINANQSSNHTIYNVPAVTTQDACIAARLVLQKAGPAGLSRNTVDNSYISAVTLLGCPSN